MGSGIGGGEGDGCVGDGGGGNGDGGGGLGDGEGGDGVGGGGNSGGGGDGGGSRITQLPSSSFAKESKLLALGARQPGRAYTQSPSAATLAAGSKTEDAVSMQPGSIATQPAAFVATESKLKAAATMQPATKYWQLPLSTLAVSSKLLAVLSVQPARTLTHPRSTVARES